MSDAKTLTIDTYYGIRESYKMELLPEGSEQLSKICKPYDFDEHKDNPDLKADVLAQSMFDTMFKHGGIGLAAPQVGLLYRVFVVGFEKENKQVFFNPEIVNIAEDESQFDEGCLSFPDLFFKVRRPNWVRLKWQHVTGEWREETFHGLTARVILHEYDHLDGMCFVERVGAARVMIAKEKRAKLRKKKERNE